MIPTTEHWRTSFRMEAQDLRGLRVASFSSCLNSMLFMWISLAVPQASGPLPFIQYRMLHLSLKYISPPLHKQVQAHQDIRYASPVCPQTAGWLSHWKKTIQLPFSASQSSVSFPKLSPQGITPLYQTSTTSSIRWGSLQKGCVKKKRLRETEIQLQCMVCGIWLLWKWYGLCSFWGRGYVLSGGLTFHCPTFVGFVLHIAILTASHQRCVHINSI